MTSDDLTSGARAQAALHAELRAEAEALGFVPTEDEMQALRSGEDTAYGELGYLLSGAGWDDEVLALMVMSPSSYLEGRRPIEVLREQPGYLSPEMVYFAYRVVPRSTRTRR
ncbi:hypothetical protein EXE59_16640 [Nocardioides eburneiflavus]|uniref:Uncharacterized protein n=1 Tax=Nocardioides eburneiflavus TaxID=2518372 RepID=A0A4Z1BVV0_9ACTN|nr:hypothetical protein [Nocardioides eburneiflavus]TGN65401.1 hypothetical protein EXE59_16640 [Nocardioides eburneiflavus]